MQACTLDYTHAGLLDLTTTPHLLLFTIRIICGKLRMQLPAMTTQPCTGAAAVTESQTMCRLTDCVPRCTWSRNVSASAAASPPCAPAPSIQQCMLHNARCCLVYVSGTSRQHNASVWMRTISDALKFAVGLGMLLAAAWMSFIPA